MTQADRVHSTPPTDTPIDTTRRRFLSQAAGVAAGGTVLALAAIPPATAAIAPASPLDPVYGLIEAHRAACLAHCEACDEQSRLERLGEWGEAGSIAEAPCNAEWEAFYDLLEFVPSTLASLTAWSAYLDEVRENDKWRFEGLDISVRIVGTLAESLRNLAAVG